jgi:hypothetical protein
MKCCGQHHVMVRLFIVQCHLKCQIYNRWEAGQLLETIINPPLEVPLTGYGRIYKYLFGQNPNKKQYEVTIGTSQLALVWIL